MLKVKNIKPIGTQVQVSANLYGWDDFDENGLIIHKKGDLKTYQTVLSVGSDVKYVKPGDVVEINFYKYAVFKEDHNSLKAANDNPIVGFRFNNVEMVDVEGDPISTILIDFRDIQYVLDDYEEVTYDPSKKKTVIIEQPKQQLILPKNLIKD